jgi:hypothetical protein
MHYLKVKLVLYFASRNWKKSLNLSVNKAAKISSIFPKHLFWDVKMDNLDAVRDQELIISRALFTTTEKTFEADIKRLEGLYSHSEIVSNLKRTHERLSLKILDLVANRYHVAKFSRVSFR